MTDIKFLTIEGIITEHITSWDDKPTCEQFDEMTFDLADHICCSISSGFDSTSTTKEDDKMIQDALHDLICDLVDERYIYG